jgi:hypothetical protein
MDPRFRGDDTERGMDTRVREDDGKYAVMPVPLRRYCPLVIPAPASSFLRRQESIPVFPPTAKTP